MYLRFVQLHVTEDRLADLRRVYDEQIIPALQVVDGCLYGGLIHSVQHHDECISLTLWSSREKAEAYEKSGIFDRLLALAQPHLTGTSEWQIRLSSDLTVTYDPVPEDPVVRAFHIGAPFDSTGIPKDSSLYVRIVSHRVQPGMAEEFKHIYATEIIPKLQQIPGCRYAYMSENVLDDDQILSITIWNSRLDANAYEESGTFALLLGKLRHTFSEVFQWKMQLERESTAQVRTTDDVKVEGYRIVTGKDLST